MIGEEVMVSLLAEGNQVQIEKLTKYINDWKVIKVNIGVIGRSGTGKSTFINTLRNLKPKDPGAAEVGVKETTVDIQSYPHPQNENLIFWDLPGVGTNKFPRANYMSLINFRKYDFFLVLSSFRFYEDDAWLAKEITKSGKKLFFVRTKIDNDVANAEKDKTGSMTETLSEIRTDVQSYLDDNGIPSQQIFLIDGHDLQAYDFDALTTCLVQSVPSLQKEALALSLFSWTNFQLLREKNEFLKKRIHLIAGKAALCVAAPGVGKPISTSILVDEANLYQKEFGLDRTSLMKLAERIGVSYTDFTTKLQMKTQQKPFTSADLAISVATIPFQVNIAKTASEVVTEYFHYKDFLSKTLDEAFDDACKIHSAYMKRNSKL